MGHVRHFVTVLIFHLVLWPDQLTVVLSICQQHTQLCPCQQRRGRRAWRSCEIAMVDFLVVGPAVLLGLVALTVGSMTSLS